ncbi:hypothetical protein WG947_05230 [Pontibacter sp. H259]|uniref:hypothetical protein n=1 Tax=Pontibacter sp. H259 TaxID=3133421 RepID=UPI0030C47F9E
MKKLFPFLMLCLVLFACSKKDADDTTPDKVQTCILKQTAATTPNGNTEAKYSYDAAGKIVKIEFYEKGTLVRYSTFAYNNKQLIENKSFHQPDGALLGFYTYTYNDANLLTQMVSNLAVNGTMQHTFTCTYEYTSDKKIAQRLMFHPDGRVMSAYMYEYENDEMRRILTYNSTGQHIQTATLQYDDKSLPLKNTPALHKAGWQMVGFPYSHNIVSYTSTSANGQVLPESYTATYEYNTAGHPTKSTRQLANGSQMVSNLTYLCQ